MNWLVRFLSLFCFITALAVVQVAWQCRLLAGQLMEAELAAQRLQTRWGQLLLEEAAMGALPRVEQVATDRLQMRAPHAQNLIVVIP